MDINLLREFFGLCTVINFAILLLSFLMLTTCHDFVSKTHARFFSLDPTKLAPVYFKWLAFYKMAIILFNLVPYMALLMMG